MKKSLLSAFFIFAFAALSFAQTVPNFSGNWILDKNLSKSTGEITETSKSVTQVGEAISYFTAPVVVKGTNRAIRTQELFYINREITAKSLPPASEKRETVMKSFFDSGNKLHLFLSEKNAESGKAVENTFDEVWELSSDGNQLKVSGSVSENGQTETYELVYNKGNGIPVMSESKTIQGGVINGKAISLVKPVYPDKAKEEGAEGTVFVQVTIDEEGNVISAQAVKGHASLFEASENAARVSKFSPTKLSGQAVKVVGIIVYNFARQ